MIEFYVYNLNFLQIFFYYLIVFSIFVFNITFEYGKEI